MAVDVQSDRTLVDAGSEEVGPMQRMETCITLVRFPARHQPGTHGLEVVQVLT